MLRQRILVVIILLPLGVWAIFMGGWIFAALMAAFFCLAAWEFGKLFQADGYQPARFLIVLGALALLIGRMLTGTNLDGPILTAYALIAITYHSFAFERGRDKAGSDFLATLGGMFYVGFLGSYVILLRQLEQGQWWLLIVLIGVWMGDSGGYFIGRAFGRHKLAPRLSPKKSWEGYFGGIAFALIATPLFANWFRTMGADIPASAVITIALVMSIFPTLGDLGESMIKRQVGVKDSSDLLLGHGGIFDRVDSWLWAIPIGYYMVIWLFIS